MAPDRTALVLSHEPPLPAISGTRVRPLNLIRQLVARGWRVSLFTIGEADDPGPEDRRQLEAVCERVVVARLGRSRPRRLAEIALGLARRRAFQESYFHSPAAAAALDGWLAEQRFDVILADQLYMYSYLPRELLGSTVLDCHNVEQRRVETMARTLWPRPRGVVARMELGSVERYERRAAESVAAILAVSESERRYFDELAPGKSTLVPNGVDCREYAFSDAVASEARILFVGGMDYSANADAASYLIRDILPRVGRRDARVTLVGRPARRVAREAARAAIPTDMPGMVIETRPYFERSRLLAVPVRFGGGTRFKILEALARGLPVLSTTVGCEGLGLTHEREIVIADDPADFASWIDRLLSDDALCESLARRGREVAEERFDWRRIGDELDGVMRRVADLPSAGPGSASGAGAR